MLIPVLLFIVGLLCLIKGGDWFVDGATGIARRFHVPELLIGATVVSIGTTLPEVMVSTTSALTGHGEIAYGNAIGSVICNAALIAAITIAVRPGKVDPKSLRTPVAFFFVAAAFYAGVAYTTGSFTRPVGLILLAMFVAYIVCNVLAMKNTPAPEEEEQAEEGSFAKELGLLAIGAVLIAVGADLLVDNGTLIAQALGVPESVIALTFVAQDEVVACIPFQYGDGLATLPDLPPVEGCFGEWPDLDYAHLTFSRTLEAVYTPYASALSTGGELPDILVDGSFGGEAKIAHTTQQASWTDAQGRAHTGMATTVTVEDPVMREISYTVHYRLQKQRGGFTLWVETPAGWEERKAQIDGSYLLLQSDSKRITFCVETRQSEAILLVAVVVLCAAVLGCAAWVRRQQKARRHKEKDAQEKSHDE